MIRTEAFGFQKLCVLPIVALDRIEGSPLLNHGVQLGVNNTIPGTHLRSTKYACRVAVRGYCLSPVTYRTLPRMIRECLRWLKFTGIQ
jgi:hypothetical protein